MIETSPNGVDHELDLWGHCGTCGRTHTDWNDGAARVMGSNASRAAGRFDPGGVQGYRAATLPDAPLRATRAEAVEDERRHLEGEPALANMEKRT